ncbi:MAG: DNA polymerase III subunit delta' [Anaerolineaceae bacterium]|nr:DNA polymerase III subunit delta' [Anaerolineaceae bacterium]
MDWNVFGHDWAVRMLQQHLDQGNMRHAYLLTGPDGVGRRTLALRFAQAMNCLSPLVDGGPCGECRICRQTIHMQHPDLSILESGEDSRSIKVEQIRELQHMLSLTPFEAKYRVGLLLNFEEATESAQNALLKTLEEAPARVVLIITADVLENLLPTIVSRCEILRLRPMNVDVLADLLREEFQYPAAESRILAHVSGGRLGTALNFHQEPRLLERRKQWLDDLISHFGSNLVERFQYAEKHFHARDLNIDRANLADACEVWLSFWRDVLVRAEGTQFSVLNLDYEAAIDQVVEQVGPMTAREQVSNLLEALGRIEANVNVWMLAEVLLMDLPRLDELTING